MDIKERELAHRKKQIDDEEKEFNDQMAKRRAALETQFKPLSIAKDGLRAALAELAKIKN